MRMVTVSNQKMTMCMQIMEDGNSRDSGRRNLDILEMDMCRERREHSSEIIIYVSAV